jgi:hypothetical protein
MVSSVFMGMVLLLGVFGNVIDGIDRIDGATAEGLLGFEFTLADAIPDHGTKGIGDELVHADFEIPADVVKLSEFINGEFDGEGAIHFFGDPIRDGIDTAFPFVDGASAWQAKFFGEFIAGEHALLAKVKKCFRGHHDGDK